MSGWIFLIIGLVMSAGDFAIGYRLLTKGGDQLAAEADGAAASAEGVQRVGRMLMLLAPIVFLVFAAIAFGLIPAGGIAPIGFGR